VRKKVRTLPLRLALERECLVRNVPVERLLTARGLPRDVMRELRDNQWIDYYRADHISCKGLIAHPSFVYGQLWFR
jgi:hypothetical protein